MILPFCYTCALLPCIVLHSTCRSSHAAVARGVWGAIAAKGHCTGRVGGRVGGQRQGQGTFITAGLCGRLVQVCFRHDVSYGLHLRVVVRDLRQRGRCQSGCQKMAVEWRYSNARPVAKPARRRQLPSKTDMRSYTVDSRIEWNSPSTKRTPDTAGVLRWAVRGLWRSSRAVAFAHLTCGGVHPPQLAGMFWATAVIAQWVTPKSKAGRHYDCSMT